MPHRSPRAWIVSLGLLALAGAPAAAEAPTASYDPILPAPPSAPAPEGVALWRVADADSELWLLGSMHLLDPDAAWRRPAIDQAVADADRAYFETPTGMIAQVRALWLVRTLGVQPRGRRLSDQLSEEGRANLTDAADVLGFDLATIESLRPWIAMLQISSLAFVREGLDASAGVESVLSPELRAAGVELRYFETTDQQLGFLADLPEETQIAALEQTLAQLNQTGEQLQRLIGAWRAGDVAGLAAEVGRGQGEAPDFHEVIITRRNQAWVETLRTELEGAGVVLVVVGAAHLVGPDGVPALLRAADPSLTIERR